MDLKLISMIVLLVAISSLLSLHTVESRPSYNDGFPLYHNRLDTERRSQNDCENSLEVREMCQRCAKAIKSRYVYPMCCERKENTREWCDKFLNFGLSAGSSSSSNNGGSSSVSVD